MGSRVVTTNMTRKNEHGIYLTDATVASAEAPTEIHDRYWRVTLTNELTAGVPTGPEDSPCFLLEIPECSTGETLVQYVLDKV